jgi:hypothetical protein
MLTPGVCAGNSLFQMPSLAITTNKVSPAGGRTGHDDEEDKEDTPGSTGVVQRESDIGDEGRDCAAELPSFLALAAAADASAGMSARECDRFCAAAAASGNRADHTSGTAHTICPL